MALAMAAAGSSGGDTARAAPRDLRERQRLAALPVLAALDELGRLTRAEVPMMCAIAKARLKVQRAECARRDELDPFLTRRQALALLALRRPVDERLREDICHWTPGRIARDWQGYARESRSAQRVLIDLLHAEQRWLATEL